MFDVFADDVVFEGHTIGRLLPELSVAMRAKIADSYDDRFSQEDMDEAVELARKESFDEGRDEGLEEATKAAKANLDDKVAEADDAGFDRGYAAGMAESANASDAAKVMALIEALQAIHNRLLPLYLGIEEPGKFKRRAPKVSEMKFAANSCCAEARRAVNQFRGN